MKCVFCVRFFTFIFKMPTQQLDAGANKGRNLYQHHNVVLGWKGLIVDIENTMG